MNCNWWWFAQFDRFERSIQFYQFLYQLIEQRINESLNLISISLYFLTITKCMWRYYATDRNRGFEFDLSTTGSDGSHRWALYLSVCIDFMFTDSIESAKINLNSILGARELASIVIRFINMPPGHGWTFTSNIIRQVMIVRQHKNAK